MARAGRQPKKRSRGSVLTKLLILVILAAIGLQLRSLHSQVQDAQAQRDALTAQVQAQEQENAALAADIAEGATEDKMKEIAQEELGLISPNHWKPTVSNRRLPAVPAPSRSGSLPLEAYLQSPVPRPQRYRRYHGAG